VGEVISLKAARDKRNARRLALGVALAAAFVCALLAARAA
jgi:hypothetical protein